jgi:hypothetical protein
MVLAAAPTLAAVALVLGASRVESVLVAFLVAALVCWDIERRFSKWLSCEHKVLLDLCESQQLLITHLRRALDNHDHNHRNQDQQ